jgi:hypothetical protein
MPVQRGKQGEVQAGDLYCKRQKSPCGRGKNHREGKEKVGRREKLPSYFEERI